MASLRAVSFGAGARLFALGSQFLVMLLLSRSMELAAFGDMMVVFTIYRLLGNMLGTGFGNLMTYHIGRKNGDPALNIRLLRSTTLLAGVIATGLMLGAVALSDEISLWFDKPGMELWLVHLSPMILFSTLSFIAMGSLDGRSRVTTAIVMSEAAPNAFLLAVLGVGLLIGSLAQEVIAAILWISLAIPWLLAIRVVYSREVTGMERLTAWDLRYVGFSMLTVLTYMRLQGIDMLLGARFFSSEEMAYYAVMSRLATQFPFFMQLVTRNFSPKAGAFLYDHNNKELNQELTLVRRNSAIGVFGQTGLILLLSPFILPMFFEAQPDYRLSILLLLAFPVVVSTAYAGQLEVLRMSGRAGLSFQVSVISAGIFVLATVVLQSVIGVSALPIGMLLALPLTVPFLVRHLARDGIRTSGWTECALSLFGLTILSTGLVFNSLANSPTGGSLLAGGALLFLAGGLALKQQTKGNAS